MFTEDDIIHTYTRAQAIEDGVLIDATATAREAGIRFPVALTSAVWGEYVRVPNGVEGQDEPGRLWDILWMLSITIRRAKDPSDTLLYELYVRNDNRWPRLVCLKAVCGPNDDASPCITVMLPEED